MLKLVEVCQLFYNCEYIPLYIYEDNTLIMSFPAQQVNTVPPALIIADLRKQLQSGINEIVYTFSESHCAYFMFHVNPVQIVVGGPVSSIACNRVLLNSLFREYVISKHDQPAFEEFIRHIPLLTSATLAWKASLLFYCLTGKILDTTTKNQFGEVTTIPHAENVSADLTEQIYDSHTQASYNNSYELEAALYRFVTEGDVEGYNDFLNHLPSYNAGKVADDDLRVMKNYGVTSITIVSRAAMTAGLPREIAYALSNTYITNMERLNQMQEVSVLLSRAILDYITRVHKIKNEALPVESGYSHLIRKSINYIHQNLNRSLSIQEIADHVNLSRSHLSTTFKKTMGISLIHYIQDAKLEEARSLLTYTDKSIAEISNYLCFSSQSHFQTVFKKKYDQTPLEFRKANSKV